MNENTPAKAPPQKPKQKRPEKSKQMSVQTNPGDNTKYLLHNMAVSALTDTEIDMTSREEVAERINAYFQLCAENDMKPSVAGFALAFGVTRKQMYQWVNGLVKYIPETVRKVIEQAYNVLTAQMEDYMQNGKINPVAGIFLMKNNMDYEDRKEITVAPVSPLGDDVPTEDLRRKYLDAIEAESGSGAENE